MYSRFQSKASNVLCGNPAWWNFRRHPKLSRSAFFLPQQLVVALLRGAPSGKLCPFIGMRISIEWLSGPRVGGLMSFLSRGDLLARPLR